MGDGGDLLCPDPVGLAHSVTVPVSLPRKSGMREFPSPTKEVVAGFGRGKGVSQELTGTAVERGRSLPTPTPPLRGVRGGNTSGRGSCRRHLTSGPPEVTRGRFSLARLSTRAYEGAALRVNPRSLGHPRPPGSSPESLGPVGPETLPRASSAGPGTGSQSRSGRGSLRGWSRGAGRRSRVSALRGRPSRSAQGRGVTHGPGLSWRDLG